MEPGQVKSDLRVRIGWDVPAMPFAMAVLTLFWGGMAALSQITVVTLTLGKLREGPFAPFIWFSAMYFLLPVMAAYMVITGFSDLYHNNVAFRSDRIVLMESALVVAWLGYVMYWLGDMSARGRHKRSTELRNDLLLDPALINSIILVSYAIGILNFLFNSWLYDPSNLTALLSDYGARDHRLDNLPSYFTSLGYNLLIVALVLHLYVRAKFYGRVGWAYLALCGVSALIMLSTGRVWYTFSAGLALFACWNLCFPGRKVGRVLIGVIAIVSLVIAGFLFRVVSNLIYIDSSAAEVSWLGLASEVTGDFFYLILGRSNVPSLPILMEVIDHFGNDIPFLKGETFWYWTSYFRPGSEVQFLGHEIKNQFYSGRPGGFPPTIFGELYANGGLILVAIGCFVLGAILKSIYERAVASGSFLFIFVYSAILFRFVFMLPKLELAALGSAIWLAIPVVVVWYTMRMVSGIKSHNIGTAS